MTLLEALQDIGKGRIIDNGCSYELIALAKGIYTFTVRTYSEEKTIKIMLNGKQGENARKIESIFYSINKQHHPIIKAEYQKIFCYPTKHHETMKGEKQPCYIELSTF